MTWIAVIAVGGVTVLAGTGGVVACCCSARRRRAQKASNPRDGESQSADGIETATEEGYYTSLRRVIPE